MRTSFRKKLLQFGNDDSIGGATSQGDQDQKGLDKVFAGVQRLGPGEQDPFGQPRANGLETNSPQELIRLVVSSQAAKCQRVEIEIGVMICLCVCLHK